VVILCTSSKGKQVKIVQYYGYTAAIARWGLPPKSTPHPPFAIHHTPGFIPTLLWYFDIHRNLRDAHFSVILNSVYRYQTTVHLFSRLPSTIWYQNKFLNVQDKMAEQRQIPQGIF
jgi:hypothetical protein